MWDRWPNISLHEIIGFVTRSHLSLSWVMSSVLSVAFFFQAEDGIRDYKVTGVQTCALPIFRRAGGPRTVGRARDYEGRAQPRSAHGSRHRARGGGAGPGWVHAEPQLPHSLREIGRASCRERV